MCNMESLQVKAFNIHGLSLRAVRETMIRLLYGLQFLHTEAKTTHCDIKRDNILLPARDDSFFDNVDATLKTRKLAAKWDSKNKRLDYSSVTMMFEVDDVHPWGGPLLGDLGAARIGVENMEPTIICTDSYRPPEIWLGIPWDSSVDIWCLGMLAWEMFHNELLLNSPMYWWRSDESWYLGKMISVLGPPPMDFLRRSEAFKKYWTEDGVWTGFDGTPVPEQLLQEREHKLKGEEKEEFLDYLRAMLDWRPEDRWTAGELLMHPWLNRDVRCCSHERFDGRVRLLRTLRVDYATRQVVVPSSEG